MRAALVLIDGARVDVLRDLLNRGDLPNLARWVIEPGGLTTGTTVFPSTTRSCSDATREAWESRGSGGSIVGARRRGAAGANNGARPVATAARRDRG